MERPVAPGTDMDNFEQEVFSAPSRTTMGSLDHQRLKQLDEIVSLSPGLAYRFILYADGSMALPYASQGVHDLFQITPAEACSDATKLFAAIHPDDRDEVIASIHASAAGLTLWQKEFRVVTADEKPYRLYARSTLEKGQQGETIWNGFIIDVTDLVEKYQTSLAVNAANQSADVARSQLIYALVNELRPPLSLLSSSNEILNRYKNNLSSEKISIQHDHIQLATNQLSELIDSIFSYCQLSHRESIHAPTSVDVISLCQEISSKIQELHKGKCQFSFNIQGDCRDVMIDAALFRRILKNILSNAFRFTHAGGAVSLLVTREKNKLLLEVIDSGIGILQEDQQRVLQPFQVGSNALGLNGLGLGLSIAQASLSHIGGTLFLTSTVGRGTTARMEIPFVTRENREISNSMYSILIVEDDPLLTTNMEVILEMEGYVVHKAGDGISGLAMVHEQRPNLILCDILMPGMDGHAFFEAIKTLPESADTAFIFISALSDHSHMRRGMLAGVDDYLVKPFSTDELLATVSTQVRKLKSLNQQKALFDVSPEKVTLLQQISKREREILLLVGRGVTSKNIADQLCISPRTVDVHRYRLMKKLDVTNAVQLAKWAEIAEKC